MTDQTRTTTAGQPSGLANPTPGIVTVWSDLGCPWATLALNTLHTAAAERGIQLVVDHRVFPLELFNSMPTPKDIVDAEIVTIAGARKELGWHLWSSPAHTYPVTMLPPMEAVQAAKDPAVGGLVGSDQLDRALRHAFYAESRCISMPSVILEIARTCPNVDADTLAERIATGTGRAHLYRDWELAKGPDIQGSPHLFTATGYAAHNPGAHYHWTNRPPLGFPRLESYDPDWTREILAGLAAEPDDSSSTTTA